MTQPVVDVRAASLAYRVARSRAVTLKEHAITSIRRRVPEDWHWALRDVSVQVRPGEVVAVVGANGAGKSTLIRLVAGMLRPATGRVVVRGESAPLMDLGSTFSPELTGLENMVVFGCLLGHSPRSIRRQADAIAAWANLEDWLDAPVRSYSTGMVARLAFAVATLQRPELLLVDEVLSVGDEQFRIRSAARIEELVQAGAAVLVVTHDLGWAEKRAGRALWLDEGRVRDVGSAPDVIAGYRSVALESC